MGGGVHIVIYIRIGISLGLERGRKVYFRESVNVVIEMSLNQGRLVQKYRALRHPLKEILKFTVPPAVALLNFRTRRKGVQGHPDFELFQSPYFSLSRKYTFRPRSKPSDIPIRIYNYMYTPPPISPLYHAVLKTGGKSEY